MGSEMCIRDRDIFHAERFACNSEFLFYESGVEFVSEADQRGDKPRIDFYFEPHEDDHITSIIGEIIIADPFTTGLFYNYIIFFLFYVKQHTTVKSPLILLLKVRLSKDWKYILEIIEKSHLTSIFQRKQSHLVKV